MVRTSIAGNSVISCNWAIFALTQLPSSGYVIFSNGGEAISLIANGKFINEKVNISCHNGWQVVRGDVDAMIGYAALRVVVSADLFRAVTGADLRAPYFFPLLAAFLFFDLE